MRGRAARAAGCVGDVEGGESHQGRDGQVAGVLTAGLPAAKVISARRLTAAQRLPEQMARLTRAASAPCGSSHDAGDLVQETFARVLARPRRLRGDDELSYLLQALRNANLPGLRDLVGLSYGKASRLGVREATITTRIHRARQRVAHTLSGMGLAAAAS